MFDTPSEPFRKSLNRLGSDEITATTAPGTFFFSSAGVSQ
jgi:hypothetical protein